MRNAAAAAGVDRADVLARRSARFDQHLRAVISGPPPVARYYQMMAYHLGWLTEGFEESTPGAGKRLRPALCMAACECVGGTAESALPAALAVELVHNFSLVHDDIEDGDERRRHRPTVWALWGTGHGVNVGDGLLVLAQLAMLETCAREGTTGADVAVAAAVALGRGSLELCEGQFLDLESQDLPTLSLQEYLAMVDRKTGALFGCATELGGLLGGAGAELARRLRRFGRALGRAFQMQDDLLGVWGDPTLTGKAAADVSRRKRGLPAAIAWERAGGAAFTELCQLYAGPEPMGDEAVARVLTLFEELDVHRRARRMVAEQFLRAASLLRSTGLSETAAAPLRELVGPISDRSS